MSFFFVIYFTSRLTLYRAFLKKMRSSVGVIGEVEINNFQYFTSHLTLHGVFQKYLQVCSFVGVINYILHSRAGLKNVRFFLDNNSFVS